MADHPARADILKALHALLETRPKDPHYRSPAAMEGAWCALARLLFDERAIQRVLLRRWPVYAVGQSPDELGWQCTTQILTAALADLTGERHG